MKSHINFISMIFRVFNYRYKKQKKKNVIEMQLYTRKTKIQISFASCFVDQEATTDNRKRKRKDPTQHDQLERKRKCRFTESRSVKHLTRWIVP